jgi:CheY-like chemotaxis protein
MHETDMAVVVSQSQGEIAELKAKGLDILPHRKRMVDEDLEQKFKDDRERLLLAGFDGYLEKPISVRELPDQVRSHCTVRET